MMKIFTALLFAVLSYFGSYAQFIPLYADSPATGSRWAILCDNNDVIWTGSSSYGLIRKDSNSVQYFNTTNSGITSNRCHAIAQDSSGKIWAGSYNGVSVFDGTNWIIYNTANSVLSNDTVSALASASNGVWLGTKNGIAFFDGINWTVYNTSNSPILNNDIRCLQIDGSNVFIGTMGGLSIFDGINWTNWPSGQSGLPAGMIREIEIVNGRLWLNIGNSVLFHQQGYFTSIDALIVNGSVNNQLTTIIWWGLTKDQAGNTYTYALGQMKGVFKIDTLFNVTFAQLQPQQTGNIDLPLLVMKSNNEVYMVGPISTTLWHFQANSNFYLLPLNWPGLTNDFLDINKVRARILNRGDLHWDPVGQTPQYQVPKDSITKPVYCSALWLGGLDQNGLLHAAAMTYRQSGRVDFFTGPLDTITGSTDTITVKQYDRFWKIDESMIQEFQMNYLNGNVQNGTYPIPEPIATWPAHGTGNHTRRLAPFIDFNSDGVYNPMDGDFPELTGHQMLWWVFNDTLWPHTETFGKAFQFEIHGKAYAFNCPGNPVADEVMNYTTFYQYKIINRSQNTYSEMYAGQWTDFDLGNASDDYVGCDTMLNTYFAYNGDPNDEGMSGYGLHPPMMNVTFLKGPLAMLNDGLDNNHNGITDEIDETNGLSSFLFYIGMGAPNGQPSGAHDIYNYLQAIWQDSLHMTYGEGGRNPANPPTNYMFSGVPFGLGWNMTSAGMLPDDMRGIGATGPFTIAPGEEQTIDFAYIFTRDSINPIAKNTADVQKIIAGFNSGNYPCLTVSLPESAPVNNQLTLYPNPATDILYANPSLQGKSFEVYSSNGQLIKSGIYTSNGISLRGFSNELYLLRVIDNAKSYTGRFIKLKD